MIGVLDPDFGLRICIGNLEISLGIGDLDLGLGNGNWDGE